MKIIKDFQDSPDDEKDTRSSQEYMNDLEEEYQARALLANSSQHKPELWPTKDFEVKYNKVKAKLDLFSSSASASKSSMVLMALADDNDVVSKKGARNGEWVKISIRKVHTLLEMEDNDDRKNYLDYLFKDIKMSILGVERTFLFEAEGFILPNHDTGRILPAESQRNTTDPLVAVTDSSMTDYDSAD
ncbi:hypothetical protein Tco_1056701 [Tanacetum coccineum]|uniref:Uncharacterized protein n=1 Tax=Tanacetum coccineum TaxID=301880 RepID=A0ABQ5H3H0_9ASTR